MGCLESVEWNGGMECWNGMVEWNSLIAVKLQIQTLFLKARQRHAKRVWVHIPLTSGAGVSAKIGSR